MARACTDINWRYIGDSIPAFLTLAIMPFTYSIAYGLIAGIVSYTILNSGAWIMMKLSGGRIVPHDYEMKDYWTYKVRGGLLPAWLRRLARGKKDFWRDYDWDAQMEGDGHLTSRDSASVGGMGWLKRSSARESKGATEGVSPISPGQQIHMQTQNAPLERVVSPDRGGMTGDRNWEMAERYLANNPNPPYGKNGFGGRDRDTDEESDIAGASRYGR